MKHINTKRNATGLFIFLMTMVLVGCQTTTQTTELPPQETPSVVTAQESFEQIQNTVQRLKKDSQYQAAILEAHKLLKKYPENRVGYLVLADLYAGQSMTEKLSKLVDVLAQKFPNEKGVLLWQVKREIQQEDFQGALDLINPLLSDKTDADSSVADPEVLYYYGLLKILQNDIEGGKVVMQALRTNDEVSESIRKQAGEIATIYDNFSEFSDGKNAHFFALLAKSLIDHQEYVLAKKFAENAGKEDANYIDAWILSGVANFKVGDFEAALVDLNLAYDQDPLRPETHFFLAETLQKLRRYTEAALYYEKALENGFEFNDSVTRQLIGIFSRQKKYDKIVQLYERLLQIEDARADEFIPAINVVLNKQKDPQKALDLAQKIYKKFPKNTVTLNLLAWAQMDNNLLEEAQKTLDKAFKLEKNNARTFLNQGFLLEKESELNEAVEWFQKSYQRGKETGESAITNLAADKYNELVQKVQATVSSDLERPTSAP